MATITANAVSSAPKGVVWNWVARTVSKVFVAVARRRTLRELSALDNHQLADIGLRRDQLTGSLFASERHIAR